MENFQQSSPQKTSFWDFWHKKIYVSGREKVIDFIFGSIIGLVLSSPFFFFNYHLDNLNIGQIIIIFSFLFAIPPISLYSLFVIILLGYFAFKRKYIFLGIFMTIFLIVSLGMLFFIL